MTKKTNEEIERMVRDTIADAIGIDTANWSSARDIDTFGVTESDRNDICMYLNESFGLIFDKSDMQELRSIDMIVDFVKDNVSDE